MTLFAVSININATPEACWAVLTDGSQWTRWNATIEMVEGAIMPGGKLKLYTKLSLGRVFPVRVTVFDSPRKMV